ncbi:MAG: hypothetical protein E5Y79_31560 [Mesorhizobium sp.]|uniref:hypothetical protein n=1 Tax=Mesorhizobium sp. TaxID=1871066 RepID=UPI0012191075|nr:hypothetical protein [Mesorhizobium sp.]TIL56056.1 MAG: hypothetical protein E5Y79_31560 [Mesorhizobium sp.]
MISAKKNFEDMLRKAAGPDANIVVAGDLVQGEMSPAMARILELRNFMRDLPEGMTRAEVDAAFDKWRAAA